MRDQKLKPVADIELRPDGWERFREAVRAAAKSGPKHRTKAADEAKPAKGEKPTS